MKKLVVSDSLLQKIMEPGLWFIFSKSPIAYDISRFVYELAMKNDLSLDIYSSAKEEIQNGIIDLIINENHIEDSDIHASKWIEFESSGYKTYSYISCNSDPDLVDTPSCYKWSFDALFHEGKRLELPNCRLNTTIIEDLSMLYSDCERDMESILSLFDKEAIRMNKTIIVFVSSASNETANVFIKNHLLM